MQRRKLLACLAGAALAALTPYAQAKSEAYPDKPIRLIVPFPPGGSVDYVARTISQRFAQAIGQTVIIDNKGGASGTIGTQEVARADADGYTLLLVFDSHAVNQSLYDIKYDTFQSFDYIGLIGTMPVALVTSKKSGLESVDAVLEAAKAAPGTLNYGSSGVGGSNHLNALAFARMAGVDITHVPYRGGGPMLTALLGGEVDMVVASLPTVIGYAQTDRANVLAIGSKSPVEQLPSAPIIAESVPDYEARSWVGMLAPAGLPEHVREHVGRALRETLEDPEVTARMERDGFQIVNSDGTEFEEMVRAETARWAALIQQEGIKVE
ncbi:tripartite tricarboxylate transporter substrate binding protein [Verticiella sediminum]|uniref:Tripartite tricarboxylate transporter substrate binding protein n=1 Tax=Verticiella sediminum TaxID=1247510 RepID=A0A556AFT6_9BURK|nr:tripartite tricarboxylate transporter substrate binding protein [Verticiella sediminum]TSH91758.1 tripartite tricarboxylate transporter substrate binding protein [Verticiella sediminum]